MISVQLRDGGSVPTVAHSGKCGGICTIFGVSEQAKRAVNFLSPLHVLLCRGAGMFRQVVQKTVFISGLCFGLLARHPVLAGEPEHLSRAQLTARPGEFAGQVEATPDSHLPDDAAQHKLPDSAVRVLTASPSQVGASGFSNDRSPAPDLPVKYWGNSFSLKFHRPSCPFAKAMSAHHVMFFNFRKQAVENGQVPCRYCLPPSWTSVRAALWHSAELPAKTQSP